MLAVVLHDPAPERRPHDLDVLARPRQRLAPRLAVPALDDLRPRRPEPEADTAARELVERGDGHRRRRGSACRHLHDRRAECDPVGASGDPRQGRHRVGSPGLRRPDRVEAEPLGLLCERHRRDGVVVPELQAETHPAILLAVTSALFPPDLLELRTRYRELMGAHVYPAETALGWEDEAADALLTELRQRAKAAGLWAPHVPPAAGGKPIRRGATRSSS